MFDRAREVGLPSAMITLPETGHGIGYIFDVLQTYPYNVRF